MPQRLCPIPTRAERRRIDVRLVADAAHYREVVEHGLLTANISIWISTANIKDAHIESPIGSSARARGRYRSLFEWLKSQADSGLEVRVLHAARPSRVLAATAAWKQGASIHRTCPRVHMKMVAVDGRLLYLGSANVTGAGLGTKSDGRRNFEAGIVTDDPLMLDELQHMFDDIWTGKRCGNCQLRAQCPAPLDGLGVRSIPHPRRPTPKLLPVPEARQSPRLALKSRKKS